MHYLKLTYVLFAALLLAMACRRHSKHKVVDKSDTKGSTEMVRYLTELVDTEKGNAQIYFKRGRAFFDLGQYRRALIDAQKALKLSSTDPELYFFLSRVYHTKSQPRESINAALQAEQRGLRNYELYRLLAVNYLNTGDADNAKKSIERLLVFNNTSETLCLRGDIYLQAKDTLEAITSYRRAVEKNRQSPRPYQALYALFWEDQPAIAEQYIDGYLAIDKENDAINLLKARLLHGRGVYDSALRYHSMVPWDTTDFARVAEVGDVYLKARKYDSSLLMATYTFRPDTGYNPGVLLAARSLDKLRRYRESKVLYELLVRRDSSAADELDKLNRKIAYLWQRKQQERELEAVKNMMPPTVERKEMP